MARQYVMPYQTTRGQMPQQQNSSNTGFGINPGQAYNTYNNIMSMMGGGAGAGSLGAYGLSQAGLSSAIGSSMFGGGSGALAGSSLAGLLGESAGAGALSSMGLGGLGAGTASGAGAGGAAASGGMAAGATALASNPVGWVVGGLSAPFIASSDPETFGSLGAVGNTGEALNGLWHGKGLQEFFDTDMLATHFIPGADLTNTLGITNDSTWDFLSPVTDFFGNIFGF